MSPCGSWGDSSGPCGPDPLRREAAVVGTGRRGDNIRGAPSGVALVRSGVARPGILGDSKRWVSTAAAAVIRRHSSSQAKSCK